MRVQVAVLNPQQIGTPSQARRYQIDDGTPWSCAAVPAFLLGISDRGGLEASYHIVVLEQDVNVIYYKKGLESTSEESWTALKPGSKCIQLG